MIKPIKDALSKGGQMPLTLVVLDEGTIYWRQYSRGNGCARGC